MPEFSTLNEYLLAAKKLIAALAPTFYSGLAVEMLKSEDAISDVATEIMLADKLWNPDHKGKKGVARTKRSYRSQRALWAIQTYISNKKKSPKIQSLSYCIDNNEKVPLSGILADKPEYNPANIVAEQEDIQITKSLINELLNSGCISNRQYQYIVGYYLEDKTLQEVGTQYGVTREAVRQGIEKGLNSFRNMI